MNTTPLIFTDNAAAKVWELIQEEGNVNLKLRVYVTGGGCSGFQYGFTFDEVVQEDDTIIKKQIGASIEKEEGEEEGGEGNATVKLLVDPLSFQYLVGA